MKVTNCFLSVIALSLLSLPAVAQEYTEHKVFSQANGSAGSYISLVCFANQMRFSVHWNTRIGTTGKYRRHLVLPGELGDTHILLRVLPDQVSTGIIDDDLQAKSLIHLILQNIKTDYLIIEVFPEDRDEATGEWEHSKYDYKAFLDAVNGVAKECNWDLTRPITARVRTAIPGAPFDD